MVVLDGLQDPGNAGAIVRAAEAFGATGAMFLKGTVSPYNPKTLRASAGSLFRVPYLHGMDAELARAALRQNQVRSVRRRAGAAQCDGPPARRCGSRARCAIDRRQRSARRERANCAAAATDVSIPTVGVESLNAAVAAGILLYEARRQRTLDRS